jgi:GAF domain-containing protein
MRGAIGPSRQLYVLHFPKVHVTGSSDYRMDAFAQQWCTAQTVSDAGLYVDDIWVRYFSIGGSSDAVGLTAYLHGLVMLGALQRDLVTYAVKELTESASSVDHADDADNAGEILSSHHSAGACMRGAWPVLRIRLRSMFDPLEAEHHRLLSLQRTNLIAAGHEKRFDRITLAAKDTFGMTSAFISLITSTRQVTKSTTGPHDMDLPRELSFCTHTITEDRTLIVPDTLKDTRFRTNPLVTGPPGLRFYAGHPLSGPGGWLIGTLCVLDTEPRAFDEHDATTLAFLAALAQTEIFTG